MSTWTKYFESGEELCTEIQRSTFWITEFSSGGIKFKTSSDRRSSLSFEKLDALYNARHKLDKLRDAGCGIIESVYNVWQEQGAGHDYTNESQYYAVLRSRLRREDSTELLFLEGGKIHIASSRVERNPNLRKLCIEAKGTNCVVCEMNFSDLYPIIGEGFIHVHHLRRVGTLDNPEYVSVDDLVPVCPNCHAMLHRREPPMPPEDLRAILRKES